MLKSAHEIPQHGARKNWQIRSLLNQFPVQFQCCRPKLILFTINHSCHRKVLQGFHQTEQVLNPIYISPEILQDAPQAASHVRSLFSANHPHS